MEVVASYTSDHAVLLHILHDFTNPFDTGFHFDGRMRKSDMVRLRPNCIHFAKHFLAQKIEFSARRGTFSISVRNWLIWLLSRVISS